VYYYWTITTKADAIAERNQFAIEFYLPAGTAIEQTAAVADSMESILRKDKRWFRLPPSSVKVLPLPYLIRTATTWK
jgi:hypothetical protein